jgi:malonyl CoA-acyl carrier protein transacylase
MNCFLFGGNHDFDPLPSNFNYSHELLIQLDNYFETEFGFKVTQILTNPTKIEIDLTNDKVRENYKNLIFTLDSKIDPLFPAAHDHCQKKLIFEEASGILELHTFRAIYLLATTKIEFDSMSKNNNFKVAGHSLGQMSAILALIQDYDLVSKLIGSYFIMSFFVEQAKNYYSYTFAWMNISLIKKPFMSLQHIQVLVDYIVSKTKLYLQISAYNTPKNFCLLGDKHAIYHFYNISRLIKTSESFETDIQSYVFVDQPLKPDYKSDICMILDKIIYPAHSCLLKNINYPNIVRPFFQRHSKHLKNHIKLFYDRFLCSVTGQLFKFNRQFILNFYDRTDSDVARKILEKSSDITDEDFIDLLLDSIFYMTCVPVYWIETMMELSPEDTVQSIGHHNYFSKWFAQIQEKLN